MGLLFENEVCSRCGGSGKYSYCQMYGSTCFKCRGAKSVLTRRGAAAQAYLTQLQTVVATDLKIGAIIEQNSITNGGQLYLYKAPVTSIGPSDSVTHISSSTNGVANPLVEYVTIKTEHAKFGIAGLHTPSNTPIRIWPNTAENIAKALEYQNSLTKSGTVRKIKKTPEVSK